MNNVKSLIFVVSSLSLAVPSVQAAQQRSGHNVDYGNGIHMIQYDDKTGFVMTVKNGPSIEFDSRTQSFVLKNADGTSKLLKVKK